MKHSRKQKEEQGIDPFYPGGGRPARKDTNEGEKFPKLAKDQEFYKLGRENG